jgi:hypothetical protein
MVRLIFGILFLSSCKDELLTLKKENVTGSKLRLDGYYTNEFNDYFHIIFLYKNGVLYTPGSVLKQELKNKELAFKNNVLPKNRIYRWGVFQIKDDIIKVERWYPYDKGSEVYLSEGKILNDTTFVLTKITKSDKPKKSEIINETYRFRQFSPKPDSTNSFIK